MYTINFRFRKKLYYFLNVKKSANLVRLLVFFILFTFILTAYIYGLIEVSSKKLVIKMSSDDFPDKNSNIYDDSALYENDHDDPRRKIILNLRPNKRSKSNGGQDILKRKFWDDPHNLTKLFLKIERFNSMIKSHLTDVDVGFVEKSKAKYEKALKEKTLKTTKLNNAAKNDDDDEDEEDDEKLLDFLGESETVTRDIFIKFLKYEKMLLVKKLETNNFKKVKDLLADYSENNNIDVK